MRPCYLSFAPSFYKQYKLQRAAGLLVWHLSTPGNLFCAWIANIKCTGCSSVYPAEHSVDHLSVLGSMATLLHNTNRHFGCLAYQDGYSSYVWPSSNSTSCFPHYIASKFCKSSDPLALLGRQPTILGLRCSLLVAQAHHWQRGLACFSCLIYFIIISILTMCTIYYQSNFQNTS